MGTAVATLLTVILGFLATQVQLLLQRGDLARIEKNVEKVPLEGIWTPPITAFLACLRAQGVWLGGLGSRFIGFAQARRIHARARGALCAMRLQVVALRLLSQTSRRML